MGLSCVVICHGKSEVIITQCIRQTLRLPIEEFAEKNGSQGRGQYKSIEISGLDRIMNNTVFGSINSFLKKYTKVETTGRGKKRKLHNFKLFIIMDVDNTKAENVRNYTSKKMFKEHWAYEYIVPILNDNNLEEVMKDSKIRYDTIKNKCSEYLELFPKGSSKKSDLEEHMRKLKCCKKTNMEEFFEYCINYKSS
jgi:hypothetical protein